MMFQETTPPMLGPDRPDAAPRPRDEVTLAVQQASAPPEITSPPQADVVEQVEPIESAEAATGAGDTSSGPLPIPAGAIEAEPDEPTLLGLPVRGEDVLPGLLVAMGVGILVVVLLRRLRTRSRTQPQAVEPYERIKHLHARAQDRGKADGAMADAEELARRLAALMDNKAARIEVLLQQADERIEALTAAGAERGSASSTDSDREAPTPAAPEASANGFTPASHDRVYELADQGRDPVAIAQELGQPVGEVELILALRT